jgi:hypothetical protein
MKYIAYFIIFILSNFTQAKSHINYLPRANNRLFLSSSVISKYGIQGIDNGWYVANVKYFNLSSGTISRYRLKVKVEYDRVTAIDFGNGGSVHSGYNSSGYFYSGGYLNFDKDYNNSIVSASTRVTILEANSNMITFDIVIE